VRAGEHAFDVSPRDIFVIPGWIPYAFEAGEELVVFSFSDRVIQEKLGFFRESRL
jgi:gentisate 1,2-dioxygenase